MAVDRDVAAVGWRCGTAGVAPFLHWERRGLALLFLPYSIPILIPMFRLIHDTPPILCTTPTASTSPAADESAFRTEWFACSAPSTIVCWYSATCATYPPTSLYPCSQKFRSATMSLRVTSEAGSAHSTVVSPSIPRRFREPHIGIDPAISTPSSECAFKVQCGTDYPRLDLAFREPRLPSCYPSSSTLCPNHDLNLDPRCSPDL